MKQRSEEEFIELLRSELDRSLELITPVTRSRLDAIRQQALETNALSSGPGMSVEIEQRLDEIRKQALARMRREEKSPGLRQLLANSLLSVSRSWQVTASITAASLVLITAVSLVLRGDNNVEFSLEQELALVATADEIELYENLDFYLWLAENGFQNQ